MAKNSGNILLDMGINLGTAGICIPSSMATDGGPCPVSSACTLLQSSVLLNIYKNETV